MRIPFVACIFGIIAGTLFVRVSGSMAEDAYHAYRSQDPRLAVAFEHPASWTAEESFGTVEAYSQVQVYGPPSLEDRLRVYLVVRILPPRGRGGRYADVRAMVEDYRRTLLPGLQIDGEDQAVVLGAPATTLRLNGAMQLPWKARHPKRIPVAGGRLFFERTGRLYELGWLATPEAADRVRAAFSRLLDTLTIPD